MVNIIGSYPDLAEIMALDGVYVHFYGKKPVPKRKIGHITICHPDKQQVESALEKVRLMMSPTI
jgi:5-(carboxyamino)imidazole ribonucleotide synthase